MSLIFWWTSASGDLAYDEVAYDELASDDVITSGALELQEHFSSDA